jgi:hypothetical protein
VRDRLPLFVGDELIGLERRRVERHLLICPDCRRERASLSGALSALHVVATEPLVSAEAPARSLWPALERQIRESRHALRPHPFARLSWLFVAGSGRDVLASPFRTSGRPVFVLAIALLLAGATAAVVDFWSPWQSTTPQARILASDRPADLDFGPMWEWMPTPLPLDLASGASMIAQTDAVRPNDLLNSSADRLGSARVDYDLDHGTPMEPDALDAKASY